MKRFLCAIVVCLFMSSSLIIFAQDDLASASDGIELKMGQTVTVTVKDLGTIVAITSIEQGKKEKEHSVVFSLGKLGNMKVLSVTNNSGVGLTYRCFLQKGDRLVETNVTPLFNLSGTQSKPPVMMETWVENFDGVVIKDIKRLPDDYLDADKNEQSPVRKETKPTEPVTTAKQPEKGEVPAPPEVDLETMGHFETAVRRARLLYEEDSAGWAGTDAAQAKIQRVAGKLPEDTQAMRYVAFKNNGSWSVLFYYVDGAGEKHPVAVQKLENPLSHNSRGKLILYDISRKDPIGKTAKPYVEIVEKGVKLFQKVTGITFAYPYNDYVIREKDGTSWFYVVKGDTDSTFAKLWQTYAVHLDATLDKVIEERKSITRPQAFPLKLAGDATSWPTKPILKLDSQYPEAEVLLFLMLHPEISPVVAAASSGTYVLRVGELPEYRGSESPEHVMEELASPGKIPTGVVVNIEQKKNPPKDMPPRDELDKMAVSGGAALFFHSYMIRRATNVIKGNPLYPEINSGFYPVVDDRSAKDIVIYFVSAGSDKPALAVRAKGPFGADYHWSFELLKNIPAPSENFKTQLELIMGAANAIDKFLGPGMHYYAPFIMEKDKVGRVYAWSEIERNVDPGWGRDKYLVGSCVILTLIKQAGQYVDVGDVVIDASTRGWILDREQSRTFKEVRSAADPKGGFFGEFEILRCRLNPWLCPRLIPHDDRWAIFKADGSLEVLSKHKSKKVKKLPKSFFPVTVYENKKLEKFWKECRTVMNRDEAPGSNKETDKDKQDLQP